MENGKFWLVVIALTIGYFWGKSGSNDASREPSYYRSVDHLGNRSDLQDQNEELEQKIEEARSNLEYVVSSAEDAEFQARMRWIETGRTEDLIRLHAAEDATNSAQSALDNLDSN